VTGIELGVIAALAAGGSALVAALAPLLFWLFYVQAGKNGPQLPHNPTPPTPQARNNQPQRHDPGQSPDMTEDEQAQQELEKQQFFDDMKSVWQGLDPSQQETVADITRNLRFSGKRVYLGTKKVDERFLGMQQVETLYPSDNMDVRPIQHPDEMISMLPSEMAMDDDIFLGRLASGDLLVTTHTKTEPLMEDIYEPEFEQSIKIIYVLIDCSGSMFDNWRTPMFKAIALKLLERAVRAQAPFMCRKFTDQVGGLHRAVTPTQARQVLNMVLNANDRGGTDIGSAILAAEQDFKGWKYTEADIMIITDGEDGGNVTAATIRDRLGKAGIRLHSIMLGTENQKLRDASNVYQIVETDEQGLFLHQPVVNE